MKEGNFKSEEMVERNTEAADREYENLKALDQPKKQKGNGQSFDELINHVKNL